MPITRRDVDAISEKMTLWDQGRGSVTGFGVRCQGQRRTFILKYNFEGRARWYTIGPFGSPWSVEEARTEAKRLLGIVASGQDPAADRKANVRPANPAIAEAKGPLKVGDLCDQYLAAARAGTVLTRFKRPKKSSTLDIDEGRIARHIKPLIGQLPVTELDRHRVHRMVADIAAGKTAVDEKTKLRGRARVSGGKTTTSRVADLLSGIMTWAVDMSIVNMNPVHGVRRFRAQPRERFLSFEELGHLGEVLRGHFPDQVRIHPYARAITELLCLSGCRLGEIVNLRWSEVDVPNQCLRLEDTKTGRSLRPVGRAVLERLRSIDRQAGSSFVFPVT